MFAIAQELSCHAHYDGWVSISIPTRYLPRPIAGAFLHAAMFEDVGLAVRGAPLARNPTWLPAVEQFGEGLFLTLDRDALQAWRARPEVQSRIADTTAKPVSAASGATSQV